MNDDFGQHRYFFARVAMAPLAAVFMVAAAPAQACSGLPRVVAYGDSVAHGMAYSNPRVTDMGFTGEGLDYPALRRGVRNLCAGDIVVISIGKNDVDALRSGKVSMASYQADLADRIDAMRAQGARPVLLGPSSTGYVSRDPAWTLYINGQMNEAFGRVAEQLHVPFLRVAGLQMERAPDGLHYTTNGYRQLLHAALARSDTGPGRPVSPR